MNTVPPSPGRRLPFRKRFPFLGTGILTTGFLVVLILYPPDRADTEQRKLSRIALPDCPGCSGDRDAMECMDRLMEEWMTGQAASPEGKDRVHHRGKALVALKVNDRKWGEARLLGFRKAWMEAIREAARAGEIRIRNRVVEETLDYDFDTPEDADRKSLQARFPDIVRSSPRGPDGGSTPEAAPRSGNTGQLVDHMIRETVRHTAESSLGIMPFRIFETFDREYNSVIGVVAVRSPWWGRLSDSIVRNHPILDSPERAREPVESQIPEDEDLPPILGVRVTWDEYGYPALVSFGQWAWTDQGLDARNRMIRREHAFKQAHLAARGNLSFFLRSSVLFGEESRKGRDARITDREQEDGDGPEVSAPVRTDITGMIDSVFERAGHSSDLEITGVTRVRRWTAPHPQVPEHRLAGSIIYWSPAREDAVRSLAGRKPRHGASSVRKVPDGPITTLPPP